MYRFRPIDNLLNKFHELENQEIYFASPQELNDPMEGYRDVYWSGDKIVWKNLLINYLRCLEHIYSLTLILSEEKKITEDDIPFLRHSSRSRTNETRKNLKDIYDEFFRYDLMKTLPESLERRLSPIRRNELLIYFRFIHPFAMNAVSEIFFRSGLMDKSIKQEVAEYANLLSAVGNFPDIINMAEQEKNQIPNVIEKFLSVLNVVTDELSLARRSSDKELNSNSFFLLSQFPEHFISAMEASIYPNWYSASFLYDCSNSAIWGHYGQNHTGVCLKFKPNEENEINIETEYGFSAGPLIGMRPHKFKKIEYHNKHVEVDFFRSIARLSKIELNATWYSDNEGNFSACGEHLNTNEDEWRNKYWDNFDRSVSTKLKEWEYENEYRLILHGDFIDYSNPNKRKLKYDFESLEGIIFCIKTKTADKIAIINIIEDKCKKLNRKEFSFYQAYYSKETGKIENQKLNSIKFDKVS